MKELTKGNPYKIIFLFTLPIFFSNVLQQLYVFFDMGFVSSAMGSYGISVLGCVLPFYAFLINFMIGAGSGLNILNSKYFGAKDIVKLRNSFYECIFLCTAISFILIGFCYIYIDVILGAINVSPSLYVDAKQYITYTMIGSIFYLYFFFNVCFLRSITNFKAPFALLLVANLVNIFLDVIFIKQLYLGTYGAALSFLITQALMTVISLAYILLKYRPLRPNMGKVTFDKSEMILNLKITLPLVSQFIFCSVGSIILQSKINTFSNDVIASYNMGNRIYWIGAQIFPAIGSSIMVYMAQNLGASNNKRILEGFKASIVISIISCGVLTLWAFVSTDFLIGLLVENPTIEMVSNIKIYIKMCLIFQLPVSILLVGRNSLQGLQYKFIPAFGGVVETLTRIAGAYWFIPVLGFTGICLSDTTPWITAGLFELYGIAKVYRIFKKRYDLEVQ